ncbi:MAG: hypothetical protein DI539_14150 [Flavobacterium psychrophilum]|nr:MAG: hypothetical protein DI539_14150 [Flavobacterium psychrophilum]
MACDLCYRRKVRCDLDEGPPCALCRQGSLKCR